LEQPVDANRQSERPLSREWPLLVLIVAIVIGVGWLVGALTTPSSAWVAELVMPPFQLPRPVSGVLSLVLSLAFAVVGWRIWLHSPKFGPDMGLWAGTLIFSWLFAPAFLAMRVVDLALALMVGMTLMVAILNIRLWRPDRLSAWLLLPCTVWVAYTAVLTAWVVTVNDI
jgi:tryptophan-rich sensory protein